MKSSALLDEVFKILNFQDISAEDGHIFRNDSKKVQKEFIYYSGILEYFGI